MNPEPTPDQPQSQQPDAAPPPGERPTSPPGHGQAQPQAPYPPPPGRLPPQPGIYPPPQGVYPPQPPAGYQGYPPQYPPQPEGYPPQQQYYPQPGGYPPPQQPYPPAFPPPPPSALTLLTAGDWTVLSGAGAFVLVSLLPWYNAPYYVNAWSAWPGVVAAVLALEVLGLLGLRMSHTRLALPVPDRIVNMVVGLAIVVFALFFLAIGVNVGNVNIAVGYIPGVGLLLGVLAGIAVAVGGYLQSPVPPATPPPTAQ